MDFIMMAGYGDYNWDVILWLFIGLVVFIAVVSVIVRKVNKNRNYYRPGRDDEHEVIKERKTRSELSKEDYDNQHKKSQK